MDFFVVFFWNCGANKTGKMVSKDVSTNEVKILCILYWPTDMLRSKCPHKGFFLVVDWIGWM